MLYDTKIIEDNTYDDLVNLMLTHDKIKLFMESEVIVSPHSSALTLALVANKNAKIIEIVDKGDGTGNQHYINIALHLGLNFNRYSHINEDMYGNFNIDCNKELFISALMTLKAIDEYENIYDYIERTGTTPIPRDS